MAWRTVVGLVLVAALATTAGCGEILSGPSETVSTPTRTPYSVPEEQRTTTQQRAQAPMPREFDVAARNHSPALRSAGQFVAVTVVHQYRGEGDQNLPPISRVLVADVAADRYWIGAPVDTANRTYASGKFYQTGTATYRRIETSNGTVRYRRADPSPTPREWSRKSLTTLPNHARQFPFERNGTVTFDGEVMTRYTATALPQGVGCASSSRSRANVQTITTVQVLALVDSRGIIRKFECVYGGYLEGGDRYTERITWTISEVGTPRVEPPATLDNQSTAAQAVGESSREPDDSERFPGTGGVVESFGTVVSNDHDILDTNAVLTLQIDPRFDAEYHPRSQ